MLVRSYTLGGATRNVHARDVREGKRTRVWDWKMCWSMESSCLDSVRGTRSEREEEDAESVLVVVVVGCLRMGRGVEDGATILV